MTKGTEAHTCIEATVRFAAEPLSRSIPNYASAIVSAEEIVARMSTL
jgi:hypothetical protein